MGVRDTQTGEPERSPEPVTPTTGTRGVIQTLREKLAAWSQVHAQQQVELLAGQRPEQ
ncbi:hypothetical protein [Halobaculum limi]|uniref:hypothetical protein n=1 Tax=Halobaculum limi TaxID=3031916 RepID=UPI002404EA77|nr:hypothetical protein [Halobaculum sp. YSMS11]